MSAVLKFEAQLETQTCGECGITFAAPTFFWREQYRKGSAGGWYCPNGHSRVFSESDADKIRREMQKQIDAEKNRADFWKLDSEARHRELISTKSQLTKTRKRISNGVCPVCKRTFVALGRHMHGQHPGFSAKESK